jgi:AraC-like DNA-binding protein
MEFKNFIPDKTISLFVKSISVFEEQNSTHKTVLPFFADGYPGLIFQETKKGLLVTPHNKKMPAFFLYGQTIKPIELIMEGSYKLIIFQLYPFVLKSFFNIHPGSINDNCYDLQQTENHELRTVIYHLQAESEVSRRIEVLSSFLHSCFQAKKESLDFKVRQAIQLIIDSKGQLNISKVCEALKLNARTFERRFLSEVGVSAKQFSKIIQFQQSLEQLTVKDYNRLTDIVYSNGFADQSHFIKVFKAFTGKTPKKFMMT